jgi:hypothetical protein
MEPSEESGGLPMQVDAWEKEASPTRQRPYRTFRALVGHASYLPHEPHRNEACR